ncbi:MAG: cardiolipin synthase [Acetatifactor sp.]|nr:cardiolipin synthase [Acetatifactor sp.]
MTDEKIFRLAKPRRKGLLSILFSRFLIIALLLIFQVLLMISFYGWLVHYIPFYSGFLAIFTLLMIVYLFNSEMDSSAKLTWMFMLALVPLPAAIFLFFTKTNAGHRKIKQREKQIIAESKNMIRQPENVMCELEEDHSGTEDLAAYMNRSGCFPIFDKTQVTYFPLGEKKFAAMLEELKKAEKYIFMEYFIVEEGYMWGRILEILVEKAKQGVDVRVMYDGMCEICLLPSDYCKRLEAQGIKAKAFSPLIPVVSSHYNYRDHRKILVIDGKVAFNGGVNLADEYINHKKLYGHWKDTALMIKGAAAKSFALLFLQMWNIDEKNAEYLPFLDDGGFVPENANGYVMPYGDCPLDDDKVGETVYMDILNRANDYVHIMTPYLILDGELETALKYAAQRGVDVKLILPGIPDKKPVYALAKTHYKALISAGVKIFEYTPGFVHAKVFVSDDKKAVVGTINLDYRSLYHHFECATYLYKTDCISEIEADFQDTLAKCRQVTEKTIQEEKISYKIMGNLIKFIAPLL